MLFEPGRIVATPGAIALAEANDVSLLLYLSRHLSGDWGDLGDEDKTANNEALKPGHEARLLSAYILPDGEKLWLITEWNRSVTTFLLPSEY